VLIGISCSWDVLNGKVLAHNINEMQALTGHMGPPSMVSPDH
jgi:hypothetical protein